MEFVALLILSVFALFKAWKMPGGKRWFVALVVIFLLGAALVGWELYELGQVNCGKLYDADTGCSRTVPQWVIPTGLGLGMLEVALSVGVLIKSAQWKKQPKDTAAL